MFHLLNSRKQNHLFLLTHFNFVVSVVPERKTTLHVRQWMWVFVSSDSFVPLIHSLGGYWLTGNLPLLSFMSHQSHHCHAPINMHIRTHRYWRRRAHAKLQAWSCHEVTLRSITTIWRGYMCFPRGCIWMEFKTVLRVDKQTKKNKWKHHFKSSIGSGLCARSCEDSFCFPSIVSRTVEPTGSC